MRFLAKFDHFDFSSVFLENSSENTPTTKSLKSPCKFFCHFVKLNIVPIETGCKNQARLLSKIRSRAIRSKLINYAW